MCKSITYMPKKCDYLIFIGSNRHFYFIFIPIVISNLLLDVIISYLTLYFSLNLNLIFFK